MEEQITIPKALDIFVYSDMYNNINNAKEWCCSNIPHFTEYMDDAFSIYIPIVNDLIELGKKLQISKADIHAIFTEIGANVDEETGNKMRALMGRWVNNASYNELIAFLLGYLKLGINCIIDHKKGIDRVSKELGLLSDSLEEGVDGEEQLLIPCAICLTWCLLIETGIAAEKGLRENKIYMPETLKIIIAIDKISRCPVNHYSKKNEKNMHDMFRAMFDILINNNSRYAGKRPHESEITYIIVIKNALKRIGIDPTDYVYRALDNGREDWSLFAFLSDNI